MSKNATTGPVKAFESESSVIVTEHFLATEKKTSLINRIILLYTLIECHRLIYIYGVTDEARPAGTALQTLQRYPGLIFRQKPFGFIPAEQSTDSFIFYSKEAPHESSRPKQSLFLRGFSRHGSHL
jgi:hypothetical protein